MQREVAPTRAINPRRSLSLFEVLIWVYRDQNAHRYLRRPYDWFLQLVAEVEPETPRPKVHHDAALIHASVMDLGSRPAELLVRYALAAEPPQLNDEEIQPRPLPAPVSRRDDLYERFETPDGALVDVKIAIAERISLPVPVVKRISRRRTIITGYVWEAFEVRYCPLRYWPSPELAEAYRAIHTDWLAAMAALARELAGARLVAHEIVDLDRWAIEPGSRLGYNPLIKTVDVGEM